jgi:hypothetical protein
MFDIVAWWGGILIFGAWFCMELVYYRVFLRETGWGILGNWARLGLDNV